MADSMQATPVDSKLALYLSAFLRGAREGGNAAKLPEWVPLMGGTGLGDLMLGKAPEGLERVAYDEPLTTGKGFTTQLRDEGLDLAMLGAGAAGPAKTGAKLAEKGAKKVGAAIAENALKPVPRALAQRGAITLGDDAPRAARLVKDEGTPQGALFEARTRREVAKQNLIDAERARIEAVEAQSASERTRRARNELSGNDYRQPDPALAAQELEAQAATDAARHRFMGESSVEDARRNFYEPIEQLRAGRSPDEALEASLARERRILDLKATQPLNLGDELGVMERAPGAGFDVPMLGRWGVHGNDLPPEAAGAIGANAQALRQQRELVRQLREANDAVNPIPEDISAPAWAMNLTDSPTGRGMGGAPAGEDWWNKALNVDPSAPPDSVRAFLEAARENPDALLQYGGMPGPEVRSLEDFAEHFGDRAGKRIHVERGEPDYDNYEPEYIKTEKPRTHGRYESMRDENGDWIMEDKAHDMGDFPMHDEYGNVKKVEAKGPTEDGEPLKVKRRAEGGEPRRDEYGDVKQQTKESEGGEPMYDDRGREKYEEVKVENPDYSGPPSDEGEVKLRGPKGEIVITDFDGDPSVYAMNAKGDGALLYQTLLAHASREGMQFPSNPGLTYDNKLRLLSNALPNWVRSGVNPRGVSHTSSGARPPATGYADGPRMMQAIAGETDARLAKYGKNPEAVQFTGDGFTVNGERAGLDDIEGQLEDLTDFRRTKVGQKTLMQNAVFKWLEKATPEQAKKAASEWREKIGGPLFGIAGATTLAGVLREQHQNETD